LTRRICTLSTSSTPNDGRINIIGISQEDLVKEFEHFGIEKYRAQQVHSWLYNKGVFSFEHMTDLPKDVRKKLHEKYFIDIGTITDDKLGLLCS
jgi:23S rRNA (adenine2503-C2)-methyltransferase